MNTASKTKPSGGRPTTKRAAEIGAAVLEATIEAFAAEGNEFSMDQVAKLAGVSKQAIYRRWSSKFDLLSDSIESLLDHGLQQPTPFNKDPISALRSFLWMHFNNDVVGPDRMAAYLRVESLKDERTRKKLIEWHDRFIETYANYLIEVQKSGLLSGEDVRVQAEILGALINSASEKLALSKRLSEHDRKEIFEQRWNAFKRMAFKASDSR